jgi:hypothetical protein
VAGFCGFPEMRDNNHYGKVFRKSVRRGLGNYNVRQSRDRHGQIVVEKQTRSLWGMTIGRWERDVNKGNHKIDTRARQPVAWSVVTIGRGD